MDNGVNIIIDNGTYKCKAGYSYDDVPSVDIPTIIGYPSSQGQVVSEEENDLVDVFIGGEAIQKGGILDLKDPVKKGLIMEEDIKYMKRIWERIIQKELSANMNDVTLVMTEAPFADYKNKQRMAEILFGKLEIKSLYITNTATLSLYANGKTTGVVVDIGYENTTCVPIYEGFTLNHAVYKQELGGKQLNEFFIRLVHEDKENNKSMYTNPTKISTINEFREKQCYVAEDYDAECKKGNDYYGSNSKNLQGYDLPDGSRVYLGIQKFKCPEMLFQPSIAVNQNIIGIHEQAFNSIKSSDEEIHRDLYLNVCLCGGSSLFPKIKPRLTKELQSLAPTGRNVSVIAPPERKYSAWLGGSILTSLDSFKSTMFVDRKEYQEDENIIFKKFF